MTVASSNRNSNPPVPAHSEMILEETVIVVLNVLSYAWQKLLKKRKFSICGADEDDITEELRKIIGYLHAFEPEKVPGFDKFETLDRDILVPGASGSEHDSRPDFVFRLFRDYRPINRVNSAFYGIHVECKPIDSSHGVGEKYCSDGLDRFVTQKKYASHVDRGIMLAYVRYTCYLPEGLKYVLDRSIKNQNNPYGIVKNVALHTDTAKPGGEKIGLTTHKRTNKRSGDITIYHLWLNSKKPCMDGRCRGCKKP